MNSKEIILLDLFSGSGGFALGLKKAGFTFSKHYFSEIDKYAIANYQYNFRKAIYAGSVETIKKGQIKTPDIITFGFPCQDLSVAGNRKGLKGKRSGLFFEALRIIREFKPRVFVFENVKGLLSSSEGRDFETVIKEIANLGLYNCQWQLLNSSWFLPQNRERIYFVGIIGSEPSPKIFPFTESCFRNQKSYEAKTQTLIAPTIDTGVGNGGHYSPYIVESGLKSSKGKQKWRTKFDQYDPNGSNSRSQSNRIYHKDGIAPTQMAGHTQTKIYHGQGKKDRIRKLTPLECERLQGFPDNWTKFGLFNGVKQEISDTQRYKMMGNAVSVSVVEAVGKRLIGNQKYMAL